MSWWTDRRRRNRVALVAFAALGVGSILLGAIFQWVEGDQRVLVVTMEPGTGQPARDVVKRACGDLPGVRVVPDRGNPDPRVQGRFPVRFSIAGTNTQQEAALQACLARHDDVIRGFLVEGR